MKKESQESVKNIIGRYPDKSSAVLPVVCASPGASSPALSLSPFTLPKPRPMC